MGTLSAEHLRQTDTYVFRESTGELLAERRWLGADEITVHNQGGLTEGGLYYRVMMRGPTTHRPLWDFYSERHDFDRWELDSMPDPA